MGSPNVYAGGFNLSGTVFENGPTALQRSPAYLSGLVQWLDTISGSDASAGSTPQKAVKTLAQAVTNSAGAGMIIIGEGSAETLAGSQALSLAGLSLWGCGSGSSRPRYTCSGAVDLFAVSGAGIRIRNIYFPASTAVTTARVNITGANCEVKDCYFECGASDTNRALRIHTSATGARVRGTTFLVTAAGGTTGLEISAAVSDTVLEDLIFDGGSFGWAGPSALLVSAAALRVSMENVSMIRRSDVNFNTTGTTYQLLGLTDDGTNRVVLTA